MRIGPHRETLRRALATHEESDLFRDVAPVDTSWGTITSRAIYRRVDAGGWLMIIDEFGDPTGVGRDLYPGFRAPDRPRRLVRITNKNQLSLARDQIVQFAPLSWTTRFLELSALYDLLRRLPALSGPHEAAPAGLSVLARLLQLGAEERSETLRRLRRQSLRVGALRMELQALLLICDSDLGKETRPFLQVGGAHPGSLNRVSEWRCWSAPAAVDDLFALVVPPVAFAGEDIYRRTIWGRTPSHRLRHLCVAEVSLEGCQMADVYVVDYEVLWNHLRESMETLRTDRYLGCHLADRIPRDELVHTTLRRIEFSLKFWSHHMRETLLRGDTALDSVSAIAMSSDGPPSTFGRRRRPIWRKGRLIGLRSLLEDWAFPLCGSNDFGLWRGSAQDGEAS